MWLVTTILSSAAFRARQVFISSYWQEGMEERVWGPWVSLDLTLGLNSPPERRRESGVWEDCLKHKRVCVFIEDS